MKGHNGLTRVFKKPRIKGCLHVMLNIEESQVVSKVVSQTYSSKRGHPRYTVIEEKKIQKLTQYRS